MGIFDSIMGRSKPVRPNLDNLFALPNAAITLDVTLGMKHTGVGSVAFRAPEGRAFDEVVTDVEQLLGATSAPDIRATQDEFGYSWLTITTTDISDTVNSLHAINTSIEAAGFGPQLLCSLVGFERKAQRLGLIYQYKRGTFYPFAPVGDQRRDNNLELQVRQVLGTDLPVEQDLTRWFPVWGAPGL